MDSVLSWFSGSAARDGDDDDDDVDSIASSTMSDDDDGREDGSLDTTRESSGDAEDATSPRASTSDVDDAESKALLPPRKILHPYSRVRDAMNAGSDTNAGLPSGLTNGGNTCFAASALQCLRRATALTAWFDDIDRWHNSARCEEKRKFCVVCEYAKHLERATASGGAHSIGRLTKDINKVAKQFRRGRQEDSHEYINALLDAMHVAFLKDLGGEKKYDLRTQETTVIYHTFGGYTLGTVKCMSCGYVSKNFQSTLDIPLEVTGKIASIEAALEMNYCTEETLSGSNMYKCSKCKTLVRAKKGSKIHVSPNVLTIPLKRYSTGRFSKITKYVHFPERFSLAPFMSDDAPYEGSDPVYDLFGVLVHQDFYASAHSGHYVAYVKLPDDTWVLCNDGRVSRVVRKRGDEAKGVYFILRARALLEMAQTFARLGIWRMPCERRGAKERCSAGDEARRRGGGTVDFSVRFDECERHRGRYGERFVDATYETSRRCRRGGLRGTVSAHGNGERRKRSRVARVGHFARLSQRSRYRSRAQHGAARCAVNRLLIKAPMLYATPVKVRLPPNVEDPVKSSFVRKTSEYRVRFPVRE